MLFFISIFGIIIYRIHSGSNYITDYPNVKICVLPDAHPAFHNSQLSYNYLQKQMGLNRGCTHIQGSLYIENLERYDNGTDPDLKFLETIVEISGMLKVMSNSIRRLPLGNLVTIRGISSSEEKYSLEISHNVKNDTHYLEDIDLHSLRAIMDKNVRINLNHGLEYLVHNVDWYQLLQNPATQTVNVKSGDLVNKNQTYQCHKSCDMWGNVKGYSIQHCFGPTDRDCQPRTKCAAINGYIWCQFTNGTQVLCDRQCVGGCSGNLPQDCVACLGVYKKNQCASNCAVQRSIVFGSNEAKPGGDTLVYTTGGLCTSQCPESLLDQNNVCVYQCDFSKYYKNGNRCIECPNQNCYTKIGDQLMCDLRTIDSNYPNNGRKYVLKKVTLQKLTDCTIILGQLSIEDESFRTGITIPMLFKHLKNVREIIGDVTFTLFTTPVKNLTFLSNLREIRGNAAANAINPGLKIFISSLEFMGLKRLEKVYGLINFDHESKLCYDNTIPWNEITVDEISTHKCDKPCHPLCTRGCWGPDNTLCYKCTFLEAGDYCVKNCIDASGFYSDYSSGSVNRTICRQCHRYCKHNCTGSTSRDCVECRFALENGNCVESCSIGYYPDNSNVNGRIICKPCHVTCYVGELLRFRNVSLACSGPSNKIGLGGCTMCNKVIKIGNSTLCHTGSCPNGFFDAKIINSWSIQPISCEACNHLCAECTDRGPHRDGCKHCKGFWNKDYCEPICPKQVQNISPRQLKPGENCPVCHPECDGGCQIENDNRKCLRCLNKKLFDNDDRKNFSCLSHCPASRNYTDYIDGSFVCHTYIETIHYQQRQKIAFIALGSSLFLALIVLAIGLLFRYKVRQSKAKADLRAYYSNFNEPNMKNLKDDHASRPPNMKRLQMIPISDLIFDANSKPLGVGAFGKVFRGYWKVMGSGGKINRLDVVVKVIHNSSKSSTDEFLEEAKVMASVSHRYCLPLIGVCLSLEKPCLVSTLAEYGSLDKYLHQFAASISSYILLKWSEQVADGMAYLSLRGIIHRDLAARNILVTRKNIVQITDFGLARFVDDTNDGIVVKTGRAPFRWLALETLLLANYSTASDIWAYGVTLWEIFTFGKRPYEELETSKVKEYLQAGNRLYQPDICTLEVYIVMIKCWLDDPQMRPSFTELTSIFEHFSHNSMRYLCIPREHATKYSSSTDTTSEAICLSPLLMDTESKLPPLFANKTDDNNYNQLSNNDSGYHLINPLLYNNNNNNNNTEYNGFLPRRKKTKRNISIDKIKGFRKFGFSRFLSNKSQDSKISQYCSNNSYDGTKTPCLSCDSTTALICHKRSIDNDGSPINPQIARLMTQESLPTSLTSRSPNKPEPRRIFMDRNIHGSITLPESSLYSNEGQLSAHNTTVLEANKPKNSPDSGNSHDFELDDYLVPSRIQSAGYYNVTPSPSGNNEPIIDLSPSNSMVQNDSYNLIIDDDYLEPISKSSR